MPPRQHGIQVHKLLRRQGQQASRFRAILQKQQQKKDRDRHRVAKYKKWLAQLEKKGVLQEYSIKDRYGEDTTPKEPQKGTDENVSLEKQEIHNDGQQIPSEKVPNSEENTLATLQESHQPSSGLESFQQFDDFQKREKMVRLQKRKDKVSS